MNRYLLLILLSSWAHVVPLSLQCETGVAYANHVLSITRSLMANADVALLKTYHVEKLDKCITDCCAEKYGSCTVASFKKDNDTEANCQHFNCRPVNKCVFLSSNSTDSFSFSSSSSPQIIVPSSHASKNDSLSTVATVTTSKPTLVQNKQEHGVTKEAVATDFEEQFALVNDNTTIKPRKGVDDVTENSFENVSRSGVKPRKGVSLDGVAILNNTKSKVKPRKGVGPYQSLPISSTVTVEPLMPVTVSTPKKVVGTSPSSSKSIKDVIADDVVSALEKVFEDDAKEKDIKPSTVASAETTMKDVQKSSTAVHPFSSTVSNSVHSLSSVEKTTTSYIQSSLTTGMVASSSVQTPDLVTPPIRDTEISNQYAMPSSNSPSILEHSKVLFHELRNGGEKTSENTPESENERKYRSSMRLVLSLVFGLLVLFSVLGVIAKRIYDNWLRRHYRRMDFLIDGMYNGYG